MTKIVCRDIFIGSFMKQIVLVLYHSSFIQGVGGRKKGVITEAMYLPNQEKNGLTISNGRVCYC